MTSPPRSAKEVIAMAIWAYNECPWDFNSPPEGMGQLQKNISLDTAIAILTALKAEEMVVVPKDDTPKMAERGYDALSLAFNWSDVDGETMCKCVSDVYRAMISAAEE